MPEWVVWTVLAALLAAGEVATLSFLLGPVALAALGAALADLLGAAVGVQMGVFIVGSIATLALVRPIARRHLRVPPQARTGTAALVGARAEVLERVDARGGQVKLAGEVWSARAFDEDAVYEVGQRVDVMKIEGATALVIQ